MSEVLEKLKEVITSSNLSPDDQNDLLIFLPVLPEKALNDLLILFQKKPKLIKDFNDDFKARLDILIDGRDKWDKLIAQEEKILEEESFKQKKDDDFF